VICQNSAVLADCIHKTVKMLCQTLFHTIYGIQTAQTSASWLPDMGDHAGTCLPGRHPLHWWTETV